MKICVTGGTGFVGRSVVSALLSEGYAVSVLTRSADKARLFGGRCRVITADPSRPGTWQREIPGHDAVINLAGENIFGRWTSRKKRMIYESRVHVTRRVVEALAGGGSGCPALLNASAVGYYRSGVDKPLGEEGPRGDDFLARVCRVWEAEAAKARAFGARVVCCRFGIVLGKGGGMLAQVLPVFRMFMGGRMGAGTQWLSWIDERDLAGIFIFLLTHPEMDGPVNCTAPFPVTNAEFSKTLSEVLRRPRIAPPVPAAMVRLLMGEAGDLVLNGCRVIPRRLTAGGFTFAFPRLRAALKDLVGCPDKGK
jgi:uncharacterized protein (TIGR01777 family)